MIPAEAVEAAAKVLYEDAAWRECWSEAPEPRKDQYIKYARLALKAAVPSMLEEARAQAWDEAITTVWDGGLDVYVPMPSANPYRS